MIRHLRSLSLAAVCWLCSPAIVWAETSAEQVLQTGDAAKAIELAESALSAGALKPELWVRHQLTLGIAHARRGEAEQARRAFICALALEPELRLAGDESVEVRSPFMEARGFWSQYSERLAASASLSDDRTALLVSLVDPVGLVARVVVRVRSVGQSGFVESALPPATGMVVALDASQRGVEYTLALIDENANRLWQLGTDEMPLRAGASAKAESSAASPQPIESAARNEHAPGERTKGASPARPYYVGAALSLLVSGGALVVAGISHAERERLAARWNRADCEGEGVTRGEVCQRERQQMKRSEGLAAGFYALAGAGVVAGLVTLIVAPSRARAERPERRAHTLRCGSGPGQWGVACTTSF